jgi:2'-hydroxyisoflavone reductase
MHTSRRSFLSISLAAGAAAIGAPALATPHRRKGLNILILGGTGFIGPDQVEAARARGHTVTLFNRGKTEKAKGGIFPDVEKLYGNRDPDKPADDTKDDQGDPVNPDSPIGLTALKGRQWDVVIDNSGYYPRQVRASAELLAPNVKHYVFISTVSVYAEHTIPNADETAPVAKTEHETREDLRGHMEDYGPLKALCEQAVEAALPGRTTIVRPGYIVGPGDPTDRFTYWPVRVDRGGEVLVPGTPDDPIQIIDARDLGDWVIHLVENNTTGVFNAVGPRDRLPMREMLAACQAATTNDAWFTWVETSFLDANPPAPEFPIWVPPEGEYAGFASRSNARAVAAGLKFRPVADTAKATLDWFKSLPADRQAKLSQGPKPEDEQAILAAWHEKTGK